MVGEGTVWQGYEVAYVENRNLRLARKGTAWLGYEVANGKNMN